MGPRVTFIGDPTMGRRAPDAVSPGILIRRASRIGASAIICQGVEVGTEAVVGAGSLVRNDVAPRTVVVGVPARHLRDVDDGELLDEWREETA